jgi:hypothetical protein
MRVWYDDKLNVRNYIDHVYRVHLGFLTSADFASKSAGDAAAGAPVAAPGAKKRAKDAEIVAASEALYPYEDKRLFIKEVARWVVTDALPFRHVQSPGFRMFCESRGLPTASASAVAAAAKEMVNLEVRVRAKASVNAWMKPVLVTDVDTSTVYKIEPPISVEADGFTARNGMHLISIILHGSQIVEGMLARENALIGIPHWALGRSPRICVKKYHPDGTPAAPLSIPITTPLSPPASRYRLSILYHRIPLAARDTPYPSDW